MLDLLCATRSFEVRPGQAPNCAGRLSPRRVKASLVTPHPTSRADAQFTTLAVGA